MTQQSPLELAKQGNPKAIAFLINRSLQPKGITAKVSLKDHCLQVMLESTHIPAQQALVSYVRKGVVSLGITDLERLKVYGRQTGEDFPAWTQELELIAKPVLELPQTNSYSSSSSSNAQQPIPKTEAKNTGLKTDPIGDTGKKPTMKAFRLDMGVGTPQTKEQQRIAKSKAYEFGISGAIIGLLISLPSVWAAFQMLQISGGGDFVLIYVIGIGVAVLIGYLSGFGQGFKQFSVNCPKCNHKFSLQDPGGDCPACGTGLYIDEHGDCNQKLQH